MFERYSIVKDLGYVEVINSVDLQICMTKKSMSEFDRVNPCFYMKVSYNEEVLSMYYIQQRSTGYTNIFNHKDTCSDIYRNVYICKVCEKHS